jgi:hypothetical protein
MFRATDPLRDLKKLESGSPVTLPLAPFSWQEAKTALLLYFVVYKAHARLSSVCGEAGEATLRMRMREPCEARPAAVP